MSADEEKEDTGMNVVSDKVGISEPQQDTSTNEASDGPGPVSGTVTTATADANDPGTVTIAREDENGVGTALGSGVNDNDDDDHHLGPSQIRKAEPNALEVGSSTLWLGKKAPIGMLMGGGPPSKPKPNETWIEVHGWLKITDNKKEPPKPSKAHPPSLFKRSGSRPSAPPREHTAKAIPAKAGGGWQS